MTVLELRQYTMVPGMRDDFVEIFDREFVDTQEAVGIEVLGQFVDLDRPDRYVWLRRFPDMDARRSALEAFYGGPAWATHKDAANATMTEWHDVLLLKPASGVGDPALDLPARPPQGQAFGPGRPMSIVIWDVGADHLPGFAEAVHRASLDLRALFVTDTSANTYQTLPIREDAGVFVAVLRELAVGPLDIAGRAPAQVLNLAPTPRSRLRGA